nr:MAG TPA: hypothetical protein [Caudoviricetes sp.]
MSEEKTFVFPESSHSGSSVDPNMLLAMMNGGNGGFGGNGNWLWVIFLFFLYGWGGNGLLGRGGSGLANEINNDYGRGLLLQAINGNGTAISQLATTLNCNVNAIQTAINSVQSSIQSVGSQVGMTGQQIINSIQSGNQAIASQLAQCCCDNKLLVTTQGYENRIATLQQTELLGSKIDTNASAVTKAIAEQTNLINDKFCALEMREMQSKIDALTTEKATLVGQISQSRQNQYIASMLAPIQSEVAQIKASLPPTVAVPYPQLQAVPTVAGQCATALFTNGQWA